MHNTTLAEGLAEGRYRSHNSSPTLEGIDPNPIKAPSFRTGLSTSATELETTRPTPTLMFSALLPSCFYHLPDSDHQIRKC